MGSNFARKSHFENFKILDLGAQTGQASSGGTSKEQATRGEEQGVSNKNLQNLAALFPDCQVERVEHAKHEILFERDYLREKAVKRILAYFATENTV